MFFGLFVFFFYAMVNNDACTLKIRWSLCRVHLQLYLDSPRPFGVLCMNHVSLSDAYIGGLTCL